MKHCSHSITAACLLVLISACAAPTDSTATTTAPPATATTTPTTTSAATTGQPAPPAPSTTLAFPPARQELEHGGTTWAVVLAGAPDAADPAIVAAETAAADAGYTVGFTDCDEGAAEALGMSGSIVTVSVYFDTREYAEAAAAAFAARGQSGVVAEVRTFCLD